ncbi:acyl transferase 15 isoform X1 [Oryza sativa Japonica Group]|jgi:hypothetical protein|uniref:Acyl transferase 15 n=2 Tax=Oryza TaxID=4527 RepID=AT15_ORYSJ|nr:acyl transferase 15 [Oryza sativa Japonica Group]XP_025876476.1 acyl transferase 15 [Oryza sativa Japonica Group]Q7XHC4.1 RecName: Full=Acyl transferase 15; Short=OsAT15 [Oryza sativa Japonica Group]AAM08506.1 Putative 10-deacetylbaccatin III-10-O-acetyl transferase [Oryza sativa Japonica Group]AAP51811.1 Transferase family protein, expressed [Oryza sativa Japonica Group]EAZ15078.1 hypothetical protein OsJ_30490 [Oryza sativa Japonica Group]KAF2912365.1 hypothetical protein DAI22_10g004200|eukprot:NP_001064028.1 Os10g0108700 [Oryza sativa Japonica Group]
MSIVVSKSAPVVVRPSEPATSTADKILLSTLDKPVATIPVTVLLAFDHPIHDATAETIKTALAQSLVHYYPIAGRISCDNDDGGHFYIDCTGEDLGVTFVAASANCTMEELMCLVDDQAPDDETAVVQQLAFNCTPDDLHHRLLWVQVTTLNCGGFVVGVTWSHGVADGPGIAQFIQAVGELARGLPSPSVVPVRLDDKIATQAVPPFTMAVHRFISGLKPVSNLDVRNVTVSSSLINHIIVGARRRATVFEAVAAVLWQCRTRVVMTDPEAPAVLLFAVNARKYLGAKDGYYGCCTAMHMAVSKSGTVANGDIMKLVGIIRRAKEQIPEQLKADDGEMMLRTMVGEKQVNGYESLLYLTSWRNIGFEDVDFGSGKTARVMTYPPRMLSMMPRIAPICFMLKATEEGVRVMSDCVTADHADAFYQEIAKLKATT